MLNTPITPPRVPIIDPRTNLIDRAWYMFFLSLFQSVTTNANVPDVGPDNAGVTERVSELTKALQSTLVGPENAGVIEQINEIAKALQSTLIGPANASVIEQISELTKQLKALQIEPANAGVLEQISELAKIVANITVVSSPDLVAPENAAVVEQISELAKQLTAFQIGPTSSGLLEQIAALRTEVQAFYLLPSNQTSVTSGVTSVDGSGGATGLTLTGGPITSAGTLTLGGTLAVASGGTGTAAPSLIAGTNVSITGAWPNQTVNSTGSGGMVTAVTGTAPVVSSGGATPAISMPAATTSVSGYLTSTDWTTFNNKGSGTVTSVAATVPSFLSVSGSPITTSGTLALTYSGTALPAANGGTGATTLTGAGIVTLTDTQTITGAKTLNNLTNQFTGTVYSTSDGTTSNGYLFENIGYAALGGTNGVVLGSGTYSGTGRIVVDVFGGLNTLRPYADNVTSLGTSVSRYTVVYATTGTINTSDATEKQQVRELDNAERRTAQRVKGLIRAFKWNEAVKSKGDGARIHVGVMAQDVEAAFAAEGLDASKYGLFCRDTWDTLDGQPQTRLGVRYEELLAFVIAAL